MSTTDITEPAALAAVPERSPLAGHVLALDGVRGLAITAVLAFHFIAHGPGYAAWPTWFRNAALTGWVGVDLFFVLSGFLITRVLLNLRGRPGALRLFYVCRALRIFPLYYGVVAAVAGLLLVQSHFSGNGTEWLNLVAVAAYLTNFNVATHDWGAAVFHSVQLTHLWTLAIEEQFYLAWPLVVLFLTKRTAVVVAMGLIVISPLLRYLLLAHGIDATAVYVLTPFRADALAWGAMIAFIERDRPQLLRHMGQPLFYGELAAVIGFIMPVSINEFDSFVQEFGYTALAGTFAGLIALAAAHELPRPLRWLLTTHPLTRLGRISYGVYLFHLPLRGLASATWRHFGHDPDTLTLPQAMLGVIGLTIATLALAWVSFLTFEQFFLRLKPRPDASS